MDQFGIPVSLFEMLIQSCTFEYDGSTQIVNSTQIFKFQINSELELCRNLWDNLACQIHYIMRL